MESKKNYNIWWGPPKKFSTTIEERKISWLELFYDLVYVIVISRITHHLAVHPDAHGMVNYVYLFIMTFWGWSNGSQYHDLHGSPGIRTRFMTLWQMMAVAALGVSLGNPEAIFTYRTTICFAILQGFITYLWWSVGIYDKNHRKLSVPYVSCYFAAFVVLLLSPLAPSPYNEGLFWLVLGLNHLPPFLNYQRLKHKNAEFNLSMSMVERLGLFTIIVFGENILGVINGVGAYTEIPAVVWTCFALGILIVFALWWIFFALIADRECRHGFLHGQVFIFLYIPTLASLGIVGATFSVLLQNMQQFASAPVRMPMLIFGAGLALFLLSMIGLTRNLLYPAEYGKAKKVIQPALTGAAGLIAGITFFFPGIALLDLLLFIFVVLLVIVVLITRIWFVLELRRIAARNDSGP